MKLLRAADAIYENIAEGCGSNSDPQLANAVRENGIVRMTLGERGDLSCQPLAPPCATRR